MIIEKLDFEHDFVCERCNETKENLAQYKLIHCAQSLINSENAELVCEDCLSEDEIKLIINQPHDEEEYKDEVKE